MSGCRSAELTFSLNVCLEKCLCAFILETGKRKQALAITMRDAFPERSDIPEDSSFCSIFPRVLLDDVAPASQFSLSAPEEDLYVSELAKEAPVLLETVWDAIFKQYDFRPPVILHAGAATRQPSLQSMSCEKTERSMAGNYWCPEANPTHPIELNNYMQDCTANSADGQPSIPEGHYVTPTTVSNGNECAGRNQNRTRNGRQPHTCSYCGKILPFASRLKEHLKKHTGEKTYNCKQCDKWFGNMAHLRRHFTIHTGEKPYKCSRCSSRFGQKAQLDVHMRIHTGEKPYVCEHCDKSYLIFLYVIFFRQIRFGISEDAMFSRFSIYQKKDMPKIA
ncbi:unnamed protein product [Gongylonema pulchrum]|uniref:Protein krueppel n=1 Tax=Gongylonema pulchrum TaxID=637853 RepID=A0A183DWH2_9BILA|nr:unnamed protein product [Gongylonema pulchrum]